MVRVKWGVIEGRLTAVRRGHIAHIWRTDSKEASHAYAWAVKSPSGLTHMGRAKSQRAAKKAARDLLVKLNPEVEKKEQLGLLKEGKN